MRVSRRVAVANLLPSAAQLSCPKRLYNRRRMCHGLVVWEVETETPQRGAQVSSEEAWRGINGAARWRQAWKARASAQAAQVSRVCAVYGRPAASAPRGRSRVCRLQSQGLWGTPPQPAHAPGPKA